MAVVVVVVVVVGGGDNVVDVGVEVPLQNFLKALVRMDAPSYEGSVDGFKFFGASLLCNTI